MTNTQRTEGSWAETFDMYSATLLCLDDNYLQLALRCWRLEALGYRVMMTTCCDLALKLVSTIPVDCAVLDYEMPQRSGVEIAKAIRSRFPALPIVLYTGAVNVPHSDCVNRIVSKSENLDELTDALADLVALHTNLREDSSRLTALLDKEIVTLTQAIIGGAGDFSDWLLADGAYGSNVMQLMERRAVLSQLISHDCLLFVSKSADKRRLIAVLLLQWPDALRLPFVFRVLAGKSHDDVAELLGMKSQDVRWSVQAAFTQLHLASEVGSSSFLTN